MNMGSYFIWASRCLTASSSYLGTDSLVTSCRGNRVLSPRSTPLRKSLLIMELGAKHIRCRDQWILTDKELEALCEVPDKVRLASEPVDQFLGEQGLFVGSLNAH